MEEIKQIFTLRLPPLDTQRSYSDSRRKWKCYVNGELKHTTSKHEDINCTFRIGTRLEVKKLFNNKIDSTFTYITGEDHATLTTDEGVWSLKAFTTPNILKVVANIKVDKNRILKNKK